MFVSALEPVSAAFISGVEVGEESEIVQEGKVAEKVVEKVNEVVEGLVGGEKS